VIFVMDTNPYTAPKAASEPAPNLQPSQRFSMRRVAILFACLVAVAAVIAIVDSILMLLITS